MMPKKMEIEKKEEVEEEEEVEVEKRKNNSNGHFLPFFFLSSSFLSSVFMVR